MKTQTEAAQALQPWRVWQISGATYSNSSSLLLCFHWFTAAGLKTTLISRYFNPNSHFLQIFFARKLIIPFCRKMFLNRSQILSIFIAQLCFPLTYAKPKKVEGCPNLGDLESQNEVSAAQLNSLILCFCEVIFFYRFKKNVWNQGTWKFRGRSIVFVWIEHYASRKGEWRDQEGKSQVN